MPPPNVETKLHKKKSHFVARPILYFPAYSRKDKLPPLKNLEYRRKCLAAHLKKLLSLQIFGCLKAPAGFALHSARINSVPAQQKLHGLRVKKELKIKYKMVAFFPYE